MKGDAFNMKYEEPEIRVEMFQSENIVMTSGINAVQNELTKSGGKIKVDNQSGISETNIFSFVL